VRLPPALHVLGLTILLSAAIELGSLPRVPSIGSGAGPCASILRPLAGGRTSTAHAQPGDLAEARLLFSEGVNHARAKQWELALAAFQAAYAIAPRPAVLFNLAAAQMRCGKLLASTANFRRFAASDDPSITRSQRQAAELQLTHVETRIPRLRVQIEGLKDGDRVLLDQARVYPDELGHDMWLDPGVHTVRIERPRGDQEVRTIAVTEGQVRVLAFRLP
jgi:hypothetical protein